MVVVVVVIAIVLAIVLALALIPVLMYKIFQIKGPQLKNFIAAAPADNADNAPTQRTVMSHI